MQWPRRGDLKWHHLASGVMLSEEGGLGRRPLQSVLALGRSFGQDSGSGSASGVGPTDCALNVLDADSIEFERELAAWLECG